METLKEKLKRTGELLRALGAFEGEVRSLASECDAEATEGATARELPGIIRGSMNEVADNVAALTDALAGVNANVDALRIKSITAGSAADAYAQAAQAEVLEGGYTLIVWATPSGNEGNTILQTRYGTNYITQVTFFEAAAGRKCKVRNASKSNGVWTMQAWQNVILPVNFQYNAATRALQYKDAISGQWVNMAVLPENGINEDAVNYLIRVWAENHFDDWAWNWYYDGVDNDEIQPLKNKVDELQQRLDTLEWQLAEKPQIEAWLAEGGTEEEHIAELMADENFGNRTFAEVQAMHAKLSEIGYTAQETVECMTDVPDLKDANIAYAKEIYDTWDPATTDLTKRWMNDTRMRIFPHIDTHSATNLYWAWYGCTNLQYFPLLDFSNVTAAVAPWVDCNKRRRTQPFDWGNLVNQMLLYSYLPLVNKWPKKISLPKVTTLNALFRDARLLTNDNMPELEYDRSKVTNYNGVYSGTRITSLPITNFGVGTSCREAYRYPYGHLGDLSGVTLQWETDKEVDIYQMFCEISWFGGVITGLPQIAEGTNIGNMNHFSYHNESLIRVPDYSHLRPTNLFYAFANCPSLERIEGLNFARLTTCDSIFYGVTYKNLKYLRIVNLGQGTCTSFAFNNLTVWGSDGGENLQSLVDSLLTNSYDRAAAGMSAATIRLASATKARLTTEQIAAITAKGFTITT